MNPVDDQDTSGDWTTSRRGERGVASCDTPVDRFGAPCGAAVLVAWEHLPAVRDGQIACCPTHGGDRFMATPLDAAVVAENVVRERATATTRWESHLTRKAA